MPSKLSPHILGVSADLRLLVEAGSPVVKLAGVFGPAQELLALRPDLTLIGRLVESYDANAEARGGVPPEEAARALVERQREQYRLNPLIKIWEGPNEPVFGNADDPTNMRAMAWYAAFETERLRLLADMGLRGVVGNFATGTPDLPMWLAFLPALDAAGQHHGFLGLHEYASPWMWWLTGNYQTANCDNRPDFQGEGDTGWVTLRYRKVYRDYLIPNGHGAVPLVITECGLDSIGAVCPGQTSGPWRKHFDFWNGYDGARDPIDYWRGPERDVERYYAEQLMWYDRELQKDDYVWGATIFTVGTIAGVWQSFDIAGTRVARFLADHIRTQRAAAPPKKEAAPAPAVTPPAVTPPPAPQPPPVVTPPPPESSTVVVPPGPGAARPQPTPNILVNASFEEGKAYFHDETRELAVPSGWAFAYTDAGTPNLPRQAAPWGRPVTALINSQGVIPEARARIFLGGVYCWKICGTNAPVWVRLFQSIAGLPVGQRYRFTAHILPDLIIRTHPQVAYASDPLSGEVRLTAKFTERLFDSGWKNGRDAPFGRYTPLTLDFVIPSIQVEVAVEVRGRWALPLGAWYIDEISLSPV